MMLQNKTYLHVGDILGSHGLKGALTLFSHTRPALAVAGYCCWWVGDSAKELKSYQVKRCWQHGKRMLAELEEITDCNQAEALRGLKVWVPDDAVDVDEGEYLWHDIIGCDVVLADGGKLLGRVTALEEYGAQDTLVVQTPEDADVEGEWMLPFIEDVIIGVDLEQARITINLLDGMDSCFTSRF